MCTIIYQSNCYLNESLKQLKMRSRDQFGCVINNKHIIIRSNQYSEFILDVYNNNISTNSDILFHGRAIPESEPDYFEPDNNNIQPFELSNGIYFAFHGIINEINGIKPNKNQSDTHLLKSYLKRINFSNITRETLQQIQRDIKGSYLIFININTYNDNSLIVINNFLACYYDPKFNRVTSVPFGTDTERLMDAYSIYNFTTFDNINLNYKITIDPPTKNLGVICSGGLDSSTVLALTKTIYPHSNIKVFHITYGQDATDNEIDAVKQLCNIYELDDPFIIDANNIFKICDPTSLLLSKNNKDISINTLEDMERDVHYVSMRNSIFSIICASLCERFDIQYLSLGVNLTEGLVYTDNGNRWFYTMKELLQTSGRKPVRFVAPLLNLLKSEIIQIGMNSNAKYDKTVSCYHPIDKHTMCGKCGSCVNRIRAFAKNNIKDPVKYNTIPDDINNMVLNEYKPSTDLSKLKMLIDHWMLDV